MHRVEPWLDIQIQRNQSAIRAVNQPEMDQCLFLRSHQIIWKLNHLKQMNVYFAMVECCTRMPTSGPQEGPNLARLILTRILRLISQDFLPHWLISQSITMKSRAPEATHLNPSFAQLPIVQLKWMFNSLHNIDGIGNLHFIYYKVKWGTRLVDFVCWLVKRSIFKKERLLA